MNTFEQSVVDAVLAHMGDDHSADSLMIAKAFGAPDATASSMVNLDGEAGVWRVTEGDSTRDLRVPWPSGAITERAQIRREVVLLYRAACEALDIEFRQADHEAGDHHGHHHGAESTATDGDKPFSLQIREGSWSDHDDSEGADFMASIMKGTATLDDYTALVVQHYYMYEVLESIIAEVADRPEFAPFHNGELARMQAVERDLERLIGENWRTEISPVPATEAYVARMREVADADWLPGIVAHHYTRYLGDLSGGQMIARRVSKQHGFEDGRGIEFYNFASLGDLAAFKDGYRDALDALGATLDEDERVRMIAEVREAYRFNTLVFIDLARARAAAV